MNTKHILCPIDFSEFNESANEFASTIAQTEGADITYMHVTAPDVPYGSFEPENLARTKHRKQRELEKVSPTTTGIDATHVVEFGSPSKRILEYAKENEIDLIVMSTHGRTGLRRLFMGSVTESVVNKSECPVLAIKSRTPVATMPLHPARATLAQATSSQQTTEMKQNGVICAIEAHDRCQEVVDLAAMFAKQHGVDLDLVHVTYSPDPAATAWPGYIASPHELSRDHRKFLEVRTNVDGVDLHYHHLSGSPAAKILDFVKRNEPWLLVVGTHGRLGIARLVGSVATALLRNAICPVMILRQRQVSQLYEKTVR